MSSLFVTSTSAATQHGVYGILRTPPASVTPAGTGIAAMVGGFQWGPGIGVLYKPTDVNDRIQTFAPYGSDHTQGAYLDTILKAFPQLWIVRAQPAAAVASTLVLQTAGAVTVCTFTAKFAGGTIGNAIACTVSAATDGNANHVDLVFTLTGASGVTSDIIRNFNGSAVGTLSVIDFTKTRLVGSIVFGTPGVCATGTFTMSTGVDGSLVAPDFIGTLGASDKGLAATEGSQSISHIFYGDPGNTLRPACNAGLLGHVNSLTSRMGYFNGISGQTSAAAQTDVASYRSYYARYLDPWVNVNDDTTGAKRLIPSAPFAAAAAAQLSPSTAISWKSPECTKFYANINSLETDRGANAYNNTLAGICTFINEPTGGISVEADVVTNAVVDPANKQSTRTQMAIYIAKSWMQSIRPSVDAPNVPYNQQPLVDALGTFLGGLKQNGTTDPNHLPYLVDYSIDSISAFNSALDIANGNFTVPATAVTGAEMSYIFMSLNIGTGVLKTNANP